MEKTFNNLWNKNHKRYAGQEKIVYDDWLVKFLPDMNKNSKILELGCGLGNNAKFLEDNGLSEIATDLSQVALKNVEKFCPNTKTMRVDLTKNLPFKDDEFDIVIADLCLHYFSSRKTEQLMKEIKRVLKNGGKLFARVNSVNDINHGAGQGEKIEDNFFFVEGYNKRFFDERDANKFFGIIGKCQVENAIMKRYEKEKQLLEIVVICEKD